MNPAWHPVIASLGAGVVMGIFATWREWCGYRRGYDAALRDHNGSNSWCPHVRPR